MDNRTKKIAELNDLLRMEDVPDLGHSVLTQGIYDLPIMDQLFIMDYVSNFDAFTPDNDPHGERDFGVFEHGGRRIFWKIDYYNKTLTGGSEDPADPDRTTRVLTIMLASEY